MMSGPRPDIDERGYYSHTHAARLLGIDKKTLYRWRKEGRIKSRPQKFTKVPKYSGKDLLNLFYS